MLLDDLRSASQPHSVLSLIAGGCHRLSEIAARLAKPSNSLSRPLEHLIDLAYVRREVPFGQSLRSTRRTFYRIDDPFMAFWYRFVLPYRSMLELDRVQPVWTRVNRELAGHVAEIWEQLCRQSVAFDPIDGIDWKPGVRWWGADRFGKPCEIDVVAESLDGKHLLVGEAKWERRTNLAAVAARLRQLKERLPFTAGRTLHFASWVRLGAGANEQSLTVRTPAQVIRMMK